MKSVYLGYEANGSVEVSLRRLTDANMCYKFVWIKSLDSTRTTKAIFAILEKYGLEAKCEQDMVIVTWNMLIRALKGNLFSGFDEIWIFRSPVPQVNSEDLVPLTSDAIVLDSSDGKNIATFFSDIQCSLMLADGCGLNFISDDLKALKSINLNQSVSFHEDI